MITEHLLNNSLCPFFCFFILQLSEFFFKHFATNVYRHPYFFYLSTLNKNKKLNNTLSYFNFVSYSTLFRRAQKEFLFGRLRYLFPPAISEVKNMKIYYLPFPSDRPIMIKQIRITFTSAILIWNISRFLFLSHKFLLKYLSAVELHKIVLFLINKDSNFLKLIIFDKLNTR